MRVLIAGVLILVLVATSAFAQPAVTTSAPLSGAPPAMVSIPRETALRIMAFFQNGGTHNESYALANSINDAIIIEQQTSQIALLQKSAAAPPPPVPVAPAPPAVPIAPPVAQSTPLPTPPSDAEAAAARLKDALAHSNHPLPPSATTSPRPPTAK